MITFIEKKRKTPLNRILSSVLVVTFCANMIVPPQFAAAQMAPQAGLNLPAPGAMLNLTHGFMPPLIKGVMIHPENPLAFDFIVEPGQEKMGNEELRAESRKLIKYFLASLTVPEDQLWVNLSPYENGRVISDTFGVTEM